MKKNLTHFNFGYYELKKIALLTVTFVFCLQTVFAYTETKSIPENNEKRFYSIGEHLAMFSCLNLIKIVNLKDGNISYQLYASTQIDPNYGYSKQNAEITVDGTAYELRVEEARSIFILTPPWLTITVNVPIDITEKIKTATNVSVKLYRYNRYADSIIIPPDYLAEWKQVIDTEK